MLTGNLLEKVNLSLILEDGSALNWRFCLGVLLGQGQMGWGPVH